MRLYILQDVDYDDFPTGSIRGVYSTQELAEAERKRMEGDRLAVGSIEVVEDSDNVLVYVPKKDLNALHELVSNYVEYWLGGMSVEKRRERNKWRPISEKLWRAENGYGFTNHPKTLEELEDEE
jgi:hypothetical protein